MKRKLIKFSFETFTKKSLKKFYGTRKGEKRLGQDIDFKKKPKYVIIGVSESIGPRANLGRAGAEKSFFPILRKLLNMQSNEFLNFKDVHVLGFVKCDMVGVDLRAQTEELDQFLLKLLRKYVENDVIPIVIGGGHNNALPLMKFTGNEIDDLNVINLDLHADYRALEGRHSGNSFSYAYKAGVLNKYTVLGLSKRYNSKTMLKNLKKDGHTYSFYEDYLDGIQDLNTDVLAFVSENQGKPVGIELDIDSIANMPSSAITPSAFTMQEARKYMRTIAQLKKVQYVHIPEGAVYEEVDENTVGKAVAHLITDFIEIHSK